MHIRCLPTANQQLPGNLPYSATKEQIEKHFEKIKPSEIRLRTYKGSDKFMGTCFVEFDRFDRMVTCLKKYHHSVFPDPKKKEGRKINVELRYANIAPYILYIRSAQKLTR